MRIQDEADELTGWFVADGGRKIQDRTSEYIRRGRRLGSSTLDEVRGAYVAAIRSWYAAGGSCQLPQDLHDAESELLLRGETIPYEQIKTEFEALKRRALEILERAKADPEGIGRMMIEDVLRLKGHENSS